MKLYIFFVWILLVGCNSDHTSANSKVVEDSITSLKENSVTNAHTSLESIDTIQVPEENFDAFFDKFDNDPGFQSSRIDFPLKLTTDNRTRFFIKKEWKFTTLSNKQVIKGQIKKVKTRKGEVKVEYSIEDTGVLVNHFFHIKNGKWWLVFIQDESD